MPAEHAPPLRTLPPPPSRGGIGLVQGRYGARGNLELMLCDESDGMWVFWFNGDPAGSPAAPGTPPPGEWSGALHFAAGRRYDDVRVLQSSHGPYHLEVLARSAAGPHRLRWSPEAAFTHEEPPPGVTARAVASAETADGTLWTAALDPDGTVLTHRADARSYPRLDWIPAGQPAVPAGGTCHDVLLVAEDGATRPGVVVTGETAGVYLTPDREALALPGSVRAAAAVAPDGGPEVYLWSGGPWLRAVRPGRDGERRVPLPGTGAVTGLAAAPVDYADRRTELVVRRGGELWHLSDPPREGGTVAAVPLASRLVAADDTGVTARRERD